MLLRAPGSSMITGVYQRGLDVRPEGGCHVGDGRIDPAESGDRSDRQQHAGNLVSVAPAASARVVPIPD